MLHLVDQIKYDFEIIIFICPVWILTCMFDLLLMGYLKKCFINADNFSSDKSATLTTYIFMLVANINYYVKPICCSF